MTNGGLNGGMPIVSVFAWATESDNISRYKQAMLILRVILPDLCIDVRQTENSFEHMLPSFIMSILNFKRRIILGTCQLLSVSVGS